MNDTTPENTPTVEVAVSALNLIRDAEEVLRDMHHQVDEVEAVCAATRARLARRHQQELN
ncbi:MAG TPA: hypothetical protein VMZ71_09745 [Gemmataceae bacterium]|nr:hypothetical protein [Gemmataceae bacterium]